MSKPRNIKQQIINLHKKGLSYTKIQQKLKCSKGTISYHLNEITKSKNKNSSNKFKKNNILQIKLQRFLTKQIKLSNNKAIKSKSDKLLYSKLHFFYTRNKIMSNKITVEQLKEKYKNGFKCYLTGEPININDSQSYELDHIIPASKGGDNSIDNLGLASKEANKAKHDKTPEEFFQLCKQILEHNGYVVTKN